MRVATRLHAARQRRFAGRTAELELFRSALSAPELPFNVLYVYGPGGIGKTTLLSEYALVCSQHEVQPIMLDARMIEPGPQALVAALQHALNLTPEHSPIQALAEPHVRRAVLIDTYELLLPLDGWLRDEFLPQLPAQTLVVVAGREAPALAWRADPGWQQLFRALPLRNLSPNESSEYLDRRAVPPAERRQVLDFTCGHPLALSLVADLYDQRPGVHFQPEEAPDIIKTLLELFVQKVPGPAHRVALEICALVHVTTEPLLAAMLELPNAHELFDWLRSLSFVASTRQGMFPHDLAREALLADLRWRNPQWYAELHRRARSFYQIRLEQTDGAEQQQVLLDYIYLHRSNPIVRPFYEWQQGFTLMAEPATRADIPKLLALVERYEGHEAAGYAAHWLERQLDGVIVLRDAGTPADAEPAGLLAIIALERATVQERAADPATDAAWRFLQQQAPLRGTQRASHIRFWIARDGYQDISSAQTVLAVQITRHYLTTPQLAYSFFPVAAPDFWAPLAAYADLVRVPAADYQIGGRQYGVYGHDWRIVPPMNWLALLGERELAADALSIRTPPPALPQVLMLSEPAFLEAAHEAIQSYARPDRLYTSPLLRSRIVSERNQATASIADRVTTLQQLIRESGELLQSSPRDARLYRAIYHTYLQPAVTQERAAELLDLPFSTYRRHLKAGMERIAELLWQWEFDRLS